jgi:hypothetical protein
MNPTNVELHIEELVLHGFAPGDSHPIASAMEAELERLFAVSGVPPSLARGGDLAELYGGPFAALPDTGANAVGTSVARAVYQGFTQ